jgi:hypothetical protein
VLIGAVILLEIDSVNSVVPCAAVPIACKRKARALCPHPTDLRYEVIVVDSNAYAYAAMTAASAQMAATANAAARIKGQVSPTPVDAFLGAWSPPPRREPL